MRLICTFSENHENPYAFAYYLAAQGIENECEEVPSEEGGPSTFRIWIEDEDQVESALGYYEEYKKDPSNPKFHEKHEDVELHEEEPAELPKKRRPRPRGGFLSPAPYGKISVLIILLCIGIFLWSQMQRKILIPPQIPGIVQAPILSPLENALIYDSPPYFQLRDRLLTLYTPEDVKENRPPSKEAEQIIQELRAMPVWMGVYDILVIYLKKGIIPQKLLGPLFTKIREGEAWRIFTPFLLHFNLLHIFFNILWFILLGNQVEYKIGPWRYTLLIVVSGAISNTAQYLMSGPFFMGLSGVVCALAAFIWARQQVAPWEGYLLQRVTLIFLGIFVLGMFLLQSVFFFLQIFTHFTFTIGIANTAHLAGGLVGYLLGRSRFFAFHSSVKLKR